MSKINLTIPCYNEQNRLPVDSIISFLKSNDQIAVLLVDDGSSDNTKSMIEAAAARLPGRIQTLCLEKNSGKAEAVRQGILKQFSCSDAEWFGYWDADLSTPLEEIRHLLEHANDSIQLLMCSRVKRLGAQIERYFWRHIAARCMATLISASLGLPVYDTQCGAKLIRRQAVQEIFSEPFLTRWLFDVEIIARLKQRYGGNQTRFPILEVPVDQWKDIAGSELKFKHMFFSLNEIARIHKHYHVRGRKQTDRPGL